MTNKILTNINGTIADLMELISSFDDEKINVIPFEGSWTVGQLVQHVVISGNGFLQILKGPVIETERKPDELVERIKAGFLDFKTKMNSPAFVMPPNINYDKEGLLRSLTDMQSSINNAIETMDLAKTCIAFELPVYGFLTRLEAICFINYHTQRHIHQLKNIRQRLYADSNNTVNADTNINF